MLKVAAAHQGRCQDSPEYHGHGPTIMVSKSRRFPTVPNRVAAGYFLLRHKIVGS
jgi:hypothetical protein